MKVKNPYRIVNLKNPRHEYSLNDTENHKYKQKILMTKILTNKKIQLLHTKHVITVINLFLIRIQPTQFWLYWMTK